MALGFTTSHYGAVIKALFINVNTCDLYFKCHLYVAVERCANECLMAAKGERLEKLMDADVRCEARFGRENEITATTFTPASDLKKFFFLLLWSQAEIPLRVCP